MASFHNPLQIKLKLNKSFQSAVKYSGVKCDLNKRSRKKIHSRNTFSSPCFHFYALYLRFVIIVYKKWTVCSHSAHAIETNLFHVFQFLTRVCALEKRSKHCLLLVSPAHFSSSNNQMNMCTFSNS